MKMKKNKKNKKKNEKNKKKKKLVASVDLTAARFQSEALFHARHRFFICTRYAFFSVYCVRLKKPRVNTVERKKMKRNGTKTSTVTRFEGHEDLWNSEEKEREGGREGGREGEREREKGNEKKNFVGSCKGVACWQSSLVNDAARVDSRVPNHHGILTPRWRSSAKSSSETRMKGEWTSEKGGATLGTSGRETGGSTRVEITSILWRWVPPSRFERPFRRVSIFCALSSLSFSSLFRTNRHTLPRSTRDRR